MYLKQLVYQRLLFLIGKKEEACQNKINSKKIADFFHVSVDYLMTGKEPEKDFSVESAHLIAQIRKDTELSDALKKYFGLSDAKKKHVIELINLLSE